MKINELYTDTFPWRWVASGNVNSANFVVDKKLEYHVDLINISDTDLDFEFDSQGAQVVEVLFDVKSLDHKIEIDGKYSVTGTGNAARVIATVIDILKDYVADVPGIILFFSAVEPSRQKLYSHIVKRMFKKYQTRDYLGRRFFIGFTG